MRKYGTMVLAVAVALVLVVALLAALTPTPATAQNTKCYMERGGTRWICGSGGTMLFQSGSTLTMAAGSTLNANGFLTTTIDELTVNGDAAITGTLDVDAAPPPGTDWSQALVSALDGIGPATAQRLADAGIETVGQLMAADPDRVAAAAGASAAKVQKWRQRGALLVG